MNSTAYETPHIKALFKEFGRQVHFEPKTQIAVEGDNSTEIAYISKGLVHFFCVNPDGDEQSLFYIGPDNMIFTEALVEGSKVLKSCNTVSQVELYIMDAKLFMSYWISRGYPLQELMKHTVGRFELLHHYIRCTHFKESEKRIAYLLYWQAKDNNGQITYTQEQLASITNVNRVTVNRIMNTFEQNGLVSQKYRKIIVENLKGLEKVFNPFD